MLSLKYYGVVHRADTEDYMQSLRSEEELDKNDFRHLMYAVRAKSTDDGPSLPEIRRSADAISEFDDEQHSPSARRSPTSRPASRIPRCCQCSSELSTSAPNYF
jgi:hypothetical protein